MKIQRKKDGTLYWSDHINGKRVKRENSAWKTKKQAQAHYDEYINELKEGLIFDSNITFRQLSVLYVNFTKTGKHKPSTIRKDQYIINRHLLPFLGDMKVRKIVVSTIDKFQEHILTKTYYVKKTDEYNKYANETLEKIQFLLRTILSFGAKRDYIKKNPFDLTFLKYNRDLASNVKQEKIKTIEHDEFNLLISVVNDLTLRTLLIYSYWVGCRPGESLGLNVLDYNQKTRTMSITKNWDDKNKKMVTTKTEEHRFPYVPYVAHVALVKLISSYPKEYISDDTPLFGFTKRLAKTTLQTHLDKRCEKAEIEKISLMTLRHTNVSLLSALGFTDQEISERTGHSIEVLNKRYKHVLRKRKSLTHDRLDDFSKNEDKMVRLWYDFNKE